MNRGTQLKVTQLKVIIVSWLIIGFFISVYDHLVLNTVNSLGTTEEYTFGISVIRNMSAGLIGALLGGSFLVFFINVRYQDKPYGFTIVAVSIFFIFVVAFITVFMGAIIVPYRTGKSLFDPVTIEAYKIFIIDSHPIKSGLAWSFVVAVTQLLLQVNSKFGQGAFWSIIRGKYNTPREEKRIFMFLDLNSSTAMAERLGDETYHSLLKDFFADITDPILNNKGNIYQYVGDEVVVSWNYKDGIENAHCIKCFFDMKSLIHRKSETYLKRYGVVPSFKAGIHSGSIVAGEIGIIKRDITYSGDVLNTTSRIQNMCKEFKAEIIASSDLTEKLLLMDIYSLQPLGHIKLRGKEKELSLSSIELRVVA